MNQSICFHDVKSFKVIATRELVNPQNMKKMFSRDIRITNEQGHETVITLFSKELSNLQLA